MDGAGWELAAGRSVNLLVLPVDDVQEVVAGHLVAADASVVGEPLHPAVELAFGDVAVKGEQVAGEQTEVVDAAALVVAVAPEQDPGVADFTWPASDGEIGAELGLD
jgi:hypothetical protein